MNHSFFTFLVLSLLYPSLFLSKSIGSERKVIYGEDNRQEISSEDRPLIAEWARSTAAMIPNHQLVESEMNNYFKMEGITLKKRYNICQDESFANQISASYCSGLLISPDTILTAGHCVQEEYYTSYAWVFDYSFDGDKNPQHNYVDNVYYSKKLIQRSTGDLDFALIKLDREVVNREPLNPRRDGKISEDAEVVVIGTPSGVPIKSTDNAFIRNNTHDIFFQVNSDTFGGNSGSAVMNMATGELEGILVRGEEDYAFDLRSRCNRPKLCSENGCRGEDIVRIKAIQEKTFFNF